MPSYKDLALDSQGIISESDSIRSFRSLTSTDEGAHWLEQAIDPMHDRGFRATGMPDSHVGQSVVRTITRKVTLKSSSPGPWDALVHFTGDLNNSMMSPVDFTYDVPTAGVDLGAAPIIKPTNGTPKAYQKQRYGGVVCVAGTTTGTNLTFTNPQAMICPFYEGDNVLDVSSIGNSVFPKGAYRIVAGSIEAYNTTPELYKSGSVTGYVMQNREAELEMCQWESNGLSQATAVPVHLVPRGPSSIAQAVQLPGSVTHEAALGGYMPLVLNVEHPLNSARYGVKAYGQREDGTQVQTYATYPIANGNLSTEARWYECANWDLPSACSPCGLYFTSLSNESTLDIVVRFVIEEFPAINDVRFLTLASPSPGLDAEALKAYGLIRNELPIMVPVSWNGLGKWIRSAVSVAKKVLPVVKPLAMPIIKKAASVVPGGNMALEAAQIAAKAISSAQNAQKAKKKKKKNGSTTGGSQ